MARKLFGVVAAVALASGAMFALVGPASAQTVNDLHIQKDVVGAVPSGTVFSVQVNCTTAGLQTVWFDDTGHASDSTGTQITAPVIHPSPTDDCTVLETHSGGASSIAYDCTKGANSSNTTCVTGDRVTYDVASGDTATITVTNTFNQTTTTTTSTTTPLTTTTTVAPKPAPKPVVAPAKFTG